ncbi:uncharacterized protein [Palaemon carinicauda]|uniref:uncharacterized protein n=1 Tax=Palaemon carinicauda TaxID=392227 RepID=UPI0035B6A03C
MAPPDISKWVQVEEGFATKWQYPNVIGAIDGKHVVITKPKNSGSLYFNYKKEFSIVLMALVDADCKFIIVDIGAHGKNSDGAIFRDSKLSKSLLSNTLNIPPPKALPNTNIVLPHVVVGDEAFPLNKNIMRPYPRSQLANNEANKIYNYRHSRARRVSENAFGILTKKFRIFSQKLQITPDHVDAVVLATTCLHNFLRDDTHLWGPGELEEKEIPKGIQSICGVGGNAMREAFDIRDSFKNYFISPQGNVPWQNEMINRHAEARWYTLKYVEVVEKFCACSKFLNVCQRMAIRPVYAGHK